MCPLDQGRRGVAARLAAIAMAAAVWLPSLATAQPRAITVFAAASLQNAIEDVGRAFTQKTGVTVRFSFAASSALARQVEQGAPAHVFASADEQWMDYLAQRNLIASDSRKSVLGNRLVLVVPASNPIKVDIGPNFNFLALLGADGRWATGDPSNVPVGRYAQEALGSLGQWQAAQGRLVRAENVRVALTFVERAEAAAGIVYETDAAVSTKVRIAGRFPADSHKPISYPFAVVAKNDSPAAREFLQFADSGAARDIWRKFGFGLR